MSEFVDIINMGMNDKDLTPADGRKFDRVEPGTYDFEVEKAIFDLSKNTGKKTLKITAKVVTEGEMLGKKMTGTYVIGDGDFERRRMKSIVIATGVDVDANGGFNREALQGLVFTADVILDEYKALNPQTGLEEMRPFTKWCSERPVEGVIQTATPSKPTPSTANAPRRPAPASTNGRPTAPRS